MVNFAIFDDFDKKCDISNWIFHKIVKCLIGCETIRMGLLKNKEKDLCTKHLCIPPDYCKSCCSTKFTRPGKYLSAHTLVILTRRERNACYFNSSDLQYTQVQFSILQTVFKREILVKWWGILVEMIKNSLDIFIFFFVFWVILEDPSLLKELMDCQSTHFLCISIDSLKINKVDLQVIGYDLFVWWFNFSKYF